jgi:hypothetical protein
MVLIVAEGAIRELVTSLRSAAARSGAGQMSLQRHFLPPPGFEAIHAGILEVLCHMNGAQA